jgi:hypothetical protein
LIFDIWYGEIYLFFVKNVKNVISLKIKKIDFGIILLDLSIQELFSISQVK